MFVHIGKSADHINTPMVRIVATIAGPSSFGGMRSRKSGRKHNSQPDLTSATIVRPIHARPWLISDDFLLCYRVVFNSLNTKHRFI